MARYFFFNTPDLYYILCNIYIHTYFKLFVDVTVNKNIY